MVVDIRVADIVGVFVILPVLNPAAVFAKAVAVRVDKDTFTANLAGCLNFGIPVSHFSASRAQSVAVDCVWGLDFYINSLIYSGGKINDQLFEARLMELFLRTVKSIFSKIVGIPNLR